MKRTLCIVACAALVLAAMSGAALAAQIVFYNQDNTTGPNWQVGGYGSGQALYWDISSGRPNYNLPAANTGGGTNPVYVESFTYHNTVAGGGSGGGHTSNGYGGGPGTTGVNYNLVMNENMTFNFSAMFYDATYGADNGGLDGSAAALEVRLIDPSAVAGADESWHAITVAQLEAGTYLTWKVKATAGETIETEVEWVNGEGVGAAGFFLDDVTVTKSTRHSANGAFADPPLAPEPAASGLLGLGLATLLGWRKRRFGTAKEDLLSSDLSRLADV